MKLIIDRFKYAIHNGVNVDSKQFLTNAVDKSFRQGVVRSNQAYKGFHVNDADVDYEVGISKQRQLL